MSRATLGLVVSLVLFSALTMAQPGGNNADKDKNKEHHSRLSELAFWHHHRESDKSAKTVPAKQTQPKPAQAKTAQMRPATLATGKKDQNQEQHAKSKAPARKTSTATKTKPQLKTQSRKTPSLKQ
jgi:hypothetical protein